MGEQIGTVGLPDPATLHHPERNGQVDVEQLKLHIGTIQDNLTRAFKFIQALQPKAAPIQGSEKVQFDGLGNQNLDILSLDEAKRRGMDLGGFRSASNFPELPTPGSQVKAGDGVKTAILEGFTEISTNFANLTEAVFNIFAGYDSETKAAKFRGIASGPGIGVLVNDDGNIELHTAVDGNYFGYDNDGYLTFLFPGGDHLVLNSAGNWVNHWNPPTNQGAGKFLNGEGNFVAISDTNTWRPLLGVHSANQAWASIVEKPDQSGHYIQLELSDVFDQNGALTIAIGKIMSQMLNSAIAGLGLEFYGFGVDEAMKIKHSKSFTLSNEVGLQLNNIASLSNKSLIIYDPDTGEFSTLLGSTDGDTIEWKSGAWTVGQSGGSLPDAPAVNPQDYVLGLSSDNEPMWRKVTT